MARAMTILTAVLCLAAAAGAAPPRGGAAGPGTAPKRAPRLERRAAPLPAEELLLIEVDVEHGSLSDSAAFVVQNAAQANYVRGGDKHFKVRTGQGEGVEFKKWGFIVNVLPAVDPSRPERVTLQVQIEISGPVGDGEVKDSITWQLQTQVTVVKGKKTLISRKPAHAEITVSEFAVPR